MRGPWYILDLDLQEDASEGCAARVLPRGGRQPRRRPSPGRSLPRNQRFVIS